MSLELEKEKRAQKLIITWRTGLKQKEQERLTTVIYILQKYIINKSTVYDHTRMFIRG